MLLPVFGLTLALAPQSVTVSQQQSTPGRGPRSIVPADRDCNLNGIDDLVEINTGQKPDCDGNQIPDECDIGQIVLVETSFEEGIPEDWVVSGSWHATTDCAPHPYCDGPTYAYYGEDDRCSFEISSFSGFMQLPEVTVPEGATSITLSYCSAYQGEGSEPYDAADVFVNNSLVDHASPDPKFQWEVRTLDLSAYIGQELDITFEFTMMDAFLNDFRGWQVDDVRLSFGVGAVLEDCNRNGIPDGCELDCDQNGTPDECDVALEMVEDCNLNGVPDSCDVALGSSQDCNANLIPDECDITSSLRVASSNLEASHPIMTGFYLNPYSFNGGLVGHCFITENSGTLYNCGGTMNTNLAARIPFTNGSVSTNPVFGPGSRYFTAKHDGLFVMAALGCSVDTFEISGQTSVAAPSVDALQLATQVNGQLYTIYVKRMYDGSGPSINQIMIIPGDGTGVTHTVPPDLASSSQTLDGLAGVDQIYYVLVSRFDAGVGGLPLRHVDAREIARELLLNVLPVPVSTDSNGNGVPDECD